MSRRRRLLIGGALVVLALAVAVGVYAYNESQPIEKRGSATEEFVVTEEPEPTPPPKRDDPRPWPTYGFDIGRQHISPYDHRPPYRRLWSIDAHDTLEFPPTIAYGRVYLAQQKGLFFALDAKTGKVDWKKSFGRCAASSPTIGKGVVYQSWMHPVECLQGQAGADRLRRRLGRRHRQGAVALEQRSRSSPRRCSATACSTSAPGTTTSWR